MLSCRRLLGITRKARVRAAGQTKKKNEVQKGLRFPLGGLLAKTLRVNNNKRKIMPLEVSQEMSFGLHFEL